MTRRATIFHTFAGRLTLLTLFTITVSVLVSWFVVSKGIKAELYKITTEDLKADTMTFIRVLELYAKKSSNRDIMPSEELEHWEQLLGTRITIIAPDGTVRADSEVSGELLKDLDNHKSRPEVRQAFSSGYGMDRRRSDTTKDMYLYYAVRTDSGFIVRCSLPLSHQHQLLSRVQKNILTSLLIAGAAALAVGMTGASRVSRPILMLAKAARTTRSGEHAIYPTEGTDEIRELSNSLRESAEAQAALMSDLKKDRNELETVVQSAPCGLMLLDANGVIICVNGVFKHLLRETPALAEGTRADGELRSPELTELIADSRAGKSQETDGHLETSFSFRQGGAEIFYKARAVPAGKGEILVILDDETERKKTESARKAFVADAGHEFQTPLTSISAAAELLAAMEDSTARERASYIEEIMRQRERMTQLVDDLLLLSRLESGAPTGASEIFDLAGMCFALVLDAKKNQLSENIEWNIDLPQSEQMFFEGRREEIKRSIWNLLDNAVKYTHKRYRNEKGGKISVQLGSSDDDYILQIADNGVGIPDDKLERIFGRFERVEDDRGRGRERTGGYGLGLAIAKTAIESHDGRIDVRSSSNGTDFTIPLPSLRQYA
jgi:two-component system phosphate regulon sensor histidine kinase PhoR